MILLRHMKGPIKNALTGIFLGIGFAVGAEIVRWLTGP